jgi:RimJ/RimL family protein N-acetyltransferase
MFHVKQFLSNSVANTLGQPVGRPLPDWAPPPRPSRETLAGRTCRLEPLSADRHASDLYAANSLDTDNAGWTYSPAGPYGSFEEYATWAKEAEKSNDPLFFAIVDLETNAAVGTATYMRIDEKNGVIEVGNIKYSPKLQQTTAATEAMYLMMKYAFDLGYRRYEWKCDSHNEPSRKAAKRLGFTFEGLFRQAVVYKGRNRDTSWFSVVDSEWPSLRQAFESWLDPANFDPDGRQIRRLPDLIAAARTGN